MDNDRDMDISADIYRQPSFRNYFYTDSKSKILELFM